MNKIDIIVLFIAIIGIFIEIVVEILKKNKLIKFGILRKKDYRMGLKYEIKNLKKKNDKLEEKIKSLNIKQQIMQQRKDEVGRYFNLKFKNRLKKYIKEYFSLSKKYNNLKKYYIEENKKLGVDKYSKILCSTALYTFLLTCVSYMTVLFRYKVLYGKSFSNIDMTDNLNIMYRIMPNCLFIVIIAFFISFIMYQIQQFIIRIFCSSEIKIYVYEARIINSIILIILDIYFLYSVYNIKSQGINKIIIPFWSLFIILIYSLKNIYYRKSIEIIKNAIVVIFVFLCFVMSIDEKYYEVSLDNDSIIEGILISDTKDRIKLIEREIEKLNPELKIVEINKNNVIRIKEPDNVKVKFIPSCKNNRTCMDLLSAYESNNKIFIKLFTSKENKENFKFDKNDKIIIKAYNIKTEKYDIINKIKYLEKYDAAENNVIYNEEGDEFGMIIKLDKNYDYKNWRVFYIEKNQYIPKNI
jgi:membrane protein